MEEGITPEVNDCRQLLEARKAKETHSRLEPPEEHSAASPLVLALWESLQISDLKNYT